MLASEATISAHSPAATMGGAGAQAVVIG